MAHNPHRQGDELFCTKCHRRWEADEEAPNECVDEPAAEATPTTQAKRKKKKAPPKPYVPMKHGRRYGRKEDHYVSV